VVYEGRLAEGTLRVRMDDGSEQESTAGEVICFPVGTPPGWPAWGAARFVELSYGTADSPPACNRSPSTVFYLA
jgi:hypothetical protein